MKFSQYLQSIAGKCVITSTQRRVYSRYTYQIGLNPRDAIRRVESSKKDSHCIVGRPTLRLDRARCFIAARDACAKVAAVTTLAGIVCAQLAARHLLSIVRNDTAKWKTELSFAEVLALVLAFAVRIESRSAQDELGLKEPRQSYYFPTLQTEHELEEVSTGSTVLAKWRQNKWRPCLQCVLAPFRGIFARISVFILNKKNCQFANQTNSLRRTRMHLY